MSRLSFPKKMLLLIVSFTLPICVLSFMMFRMQTREIDFAQKERLGIAYQKPVEKILRAVSLHRLSYNKAAFLGNSEIAKKNEVLNQEIMSAFKELKAVNNEIGEVLEFTSESLNKRGRMEASYSVAWAEWQKIPETHKYEPLLFSLRAMITHLGDLSNLILDTDLDSYYLSDLVVGALPQNQDRIQNILVDVGPMLVQKKLSSSDRVKAAVYYSMLKQVDLPRIISDVQTALNEDPNFHGSSISLQRYMPPALASYRETADKFHNQLERISFAESATSAEDFLATGTEYLESSFELWKTSAEQLDWLLQKRISVLSRDRMLNLGIILVVLAVSCGFAIKISRSLK